MVIFPVEYIINNTHLYHVMHKRKGSKTILLRNTPLPFVVFKQT